MYLARDVRWLVAHVRNLQNEQLNDVFAELNQVRLRCGRAFPRRFRSKKPPPPRTIAFRLTLVLYLWSWRQLMTLLTATPNITDFLDTSARSTRFSRVRVPVVKAALVKLMNHYNSPQGNLVGHRRRMQVVSSGIVRRSLLTIAQKRLTDDPRFQEDLQRALALTR